MKSHLQVKVYSMSAEMTYIRRQEEKWKNKVRYARQKVAAMRTSQAELSVQYAENNFWSHRHHRYAMKEEARTAHLAHGFMKGRSYELMEFICYGQLKGYGSSEPDWKAIQAMVERFSKDETNPQDWMQRFSQWLEWAKVWYEGNKQRIEAFNKGRPARLAALKALKKPYERPKAQEKSVSNAFSNASHQS